MLNLFRLVLILSFFLSFSGVVKPSDPVVVATAETGLDALRNEDEEFIPWTPYRKLSWEDFQSEPKRNTDAVASTSTALGIAYRVKNNVFKYEITCSFSKIKSWGLVKTPYILAHEQGHFDITEIFARKLHQAFQEYKFDKLTFRTDINNIYQRIVEEKETFQQAYDKITDHSRRRSEQMFWLETIEKILKETEPYADYP
ncbi:MAG: DUF922 domain-containing protein [Chitinophagaceae bacterium]